MTDSEVPSSKEMPATELGSVTQTETAPVAQAEIHAQDSVPADRPSFPVAPSPEAATGQRDVVEADEPKSLATEGIATTNVPLSPPEATPAPAPIELAPMPEAQPEVKTDIPAAAEVAAMPTMAKQREEVMATPEAPAAEPTTPIETPPVAVAPEAPKKRSFIDMLLNRNK